MLKSTNSFTKRLVANFVDVNKIRVCISILQKHAFWTIRNQNLNPIVQKIAFLKNREENSRHYCQKRCFVKNKNSDRNHCLLLSWFLPQICPKKLIFLYFSIVFLFIKTINNNKSERLIYTIMFAGGIFRNVKKDKENSKCLFKDNYHKFIFKDNLVFFVFLTKSWPKIIFWSMIIEPNKVDQQSNFDIY